MSSDLFKGTAENYARFRVPYPQSVFDHLIAIGNLSGDGSLLDLGCGTGELAVPLAPNFANVTAVDPDSAMVEEGKKRAASKGISNICWHVSAAEEYSPEDTPLSMVTIGAAFHWMDRELIASRCHKWLKPGDVLAILGSTSTWTGTAEWQEVARSVLKKWIGEDRRAGSGKFAKPKERYEDVLSDTGYSVERKDFPVEWKWGLDEFIGYLRSTSFASESVLGDNAVPFEQDMRRTLLEFDARGTYDETLLFYCVSGICKS